MQKTTGSTTVVFYWTKAADSARLFYRMLNGIKIYSSDAVWCRILVGMGADIVENPTFADVNMDGMDLKLPVWPNQLKSEILKAMDNGYSLGQILGRDVSLSRLQAQIVILLHKTGGMSGAALRRTLGYAPDTATHAVDTAIYQLRRTFGHEFITNENGVYKIGKI